MKINNGNRMNVYRRYIFCWLMCLWCSWAHRTYSHTVRWDSLECPLSSATLENWPLDQCQELSDWYRWTWHGLLHVEPGARLCSIRHLLILYQRGEPENQTWVWNQPENSLSRRNVFNFYKIRRRKTIKWYVLVLLFQRAIGLVSTKYLNRV